MGLVTTKSALGTAVTLARWAISRCFWRILPLSSGLPSDSLCSCFDFLVAHLQALQEQELLQRHIDQATANTTTSSMSRPVDDPVTHLRASAAAPPKDGKVGHAPECRTLMWNQPTVARMSISSTFFSAVISCCLETDVAQARDRVDAVELRHDGLEAEDPAARHQRRRDGRPR